MDSVLLVVHVMLIGQEVERHDTEPSCCVSKPIPLRYVSMLPCIKVSVTLGVKQCSLLQCTVTTVV